MTALSPADWQAVEPLLDAALALPPADRPKFLDTLPAEHQRWRAALERLLQAEAAAADAGFLSQAASLAGGLPGTQSTEGSGGAAPLWHAGQHVGPWVLMAELGRGGMASVWRARPHSGDFQREVALKLPHSPAPGWLERLKRERDLLARLQHAGIARLYDAGVDANGLPWLAMECVAGRDILAWCEARQAGVPERVKLLLQVADALQYAHSRLVLHRDIKPANVMVQDDGQVRLLDFGIARSLAAEGEAALTQLGQRPMTPEYASPEQVRGEEPGVASDVYALGVLAYRLLSGASPYAAVAPASRHALERAVLETEPPAPSTAAAAAASAATRKALRGDLDAIVLKALSKEPGRRYPTMDALAADLRRHLAGEAVLARPPSWRYRAGRVVARHRWAVGASTLAVLGLMGTAGWALNSASEARRQTTRAEAIYGFMRGLFNPSGQAEPDLAARDMTLESLVAAGAERIKTQLRDEPQARAILLGDLAELADQFGHPDTAEQLYDERIESERIAHGASSLDYGMALVGKSRWLERRKAHEAAYALAEQAVVLMEGLPRVPPRALAQALLARVTPRVLKSPRDSQVHADIARVLRLADQQGEAGLRDQALMNRALAAMRTDRWADALADARRVADDLAVRGLGDSQERVKALSLSAEMLDYQGHWSDAMRLRKEALAIAGRIWGTSHYRYAEIEVAIARLQMDSVDRLDGLARVRRASLVLNRPEWAGRDREEIGDDQDLDATMLKFLWRVGDLAGAAAICKRHPEDQADAGPAQPLLLNYCGLVALTAGDLDRASRQVQLACRLYERDFPGSLLRQNACRAAMGLLALERGEERDALALLTEVSQNPASSASSEGVRALTWDGLGRLDPVDPKVVDLAVLRSQLKAIEDAPERDYQAHYEAYKREALGRALFARGQWASAGTELRQVVALRERMDDAEQGIWLARARLMLARILSAQNAHEQARSLAGLAQRALSRQPALGLSLRRDLQEAQRLSERG